jgi:hypothetical protein
LPGLIPNLDISQMAPSHRPSEVILVRSTPSILDYTVYTERRYRQEAINAGKGWFGGIIVKKLKVLFMVHAVFNARV